MCSVTALARSLEPLDVAARHDDPAEERTLHLAAIPQGLVAGMAGELTGAESAFETLPNPKGTMPYDDLRTKRRTPSDGHERGVVCTCGEGTDERLVRRIHDGTTGKHRDIRLLRGRKVVHQLRVRIRKGESDLALRHRSRRPRAIAVADAGAQRPLREGSREASERQPLKLVDLVWVRTSSVFTKGSSADMRRSARQRRLHSPKFPHSRRHGGSSGNTGGPVV